MIGVGAMALATSAQADLTLQLSPANRPAAAGGTVTFSGLLTNTSATDKLYLNNIQASLSTGTTTLKSNSFFGNVPGILLPGETYNGPLFGVKLESGVANGNYNGSVTLQGGADIFANGTLASSNLTLLATPIEQWRFNAFGDFATDALAADTADFDHDGVSNLLEYALGMNAASMDRGALPAAQRIGGHLALSYVPAATDVTYGVESSTDLVTWSSVDVEQVTLANPNPPESLTFWCKTPMLNSTRVFLRIKVTR